MLRQLVLSLAMIGLYGGTVGGDEKAPDIATWRWHVSGILEAQRADPPYQLATDAAFRQSYERYAPNGMPEAPPHGLKK